jgi:hypothetical protein
VLDFGDEDCFGGSWGTSVQPGLDERFEAPDIDIIIIHNLAEIIIIRT